MTYKDWERYAERQEEIAEEMDEAIRNEFSRKKAKRIEREIQEIIG